MESRRENALPTYEGRGLGRLRATHTDPPLILNAIREARGVDGSMRSGIAKIVREIRSIEQQAREPVRIELQGDGRYRVHGPRPTLSELMDAPARLLADGK